MLIHFNPVQLQFDGQGHKFLWNLFYVNGWLKSM